MTRTAWQRKKYRKLEEAVSADGKTVGEWLYDEMRRRFPSMRGRFTDGHAFNRSRYEKVAQNLIDQVLAAIDGDE